MPVTLRKPTHPMHCGTEFRRYPDGRLVALCHPEHDAGVNLAPVTLAPPACRVFTPAELDARIAYYAERAEARLPLFADGPPAPPEPDAGVSVCGERCPSGNQVTLAGWVSLSACPGSWHTRLVYCPPCAGYLPMEDDDDE